MIKIKMIRIMMGGRSNDSNEIIIIHCRYFATVPSKDILAQQNIKNRWKLLLLSVMWFYFLQNDFSLCNAIIFIKGLLKLSKLYKDSGKQISAPKTQSFIYNLMSKLVISICNQQVCKISFLCEYYMSYLIHPSYSLKDLIYFVPAAKNNI